MSRSNTWVLIGIAVIFALALWVLLPPDAERFGRQGIQFGLDLKGGLRLVYQADLSSVNPGNEDEIMDGVVAVIANRINPLGVTEPHFERRGTDQIVVELPGTDITDVQKNRIGRTALLVFAEHAADDEEALWENELGKWKPAAGVIDGEEKVLNSSYFKENTYVDRRSLGQIMLHFEWNKEGADLSEQITGRLVGQPLAIFEGEGEDAQPLRDVDGRPYAPRVNDVIKDRGVITGLSLPDATELSKQLNAGRLPVPLTAVGEMKISPKLGEDFVDLSVRAGLIGIALVMLFMMLYYRFPGLMASLALVFYGVIVLALFKLLAVTLTLAGIGGFVLSLGMAVDANVLIFERMKEELRGGRPLRTAIETGFDRAWTAIRDSNVTTFIVCGILIWVGSSIAFGGSVQGFGLTLLIGVAVSMLTAIIVTRSFLRLLVRSGLAQHPRLFSVYSGRQDA